MRWLRLLPFVAAVAAACGGSAAYDPKGSPNVAGAAGKASEDAGASNGGVPGNGGSATGGTPANAGGGTGGGSAGALGEAGASAGAGDGGDAGAGGQVSPGCQGLDCLAGAELVYWPDREWQRTTSSTSNELLEADYKQKMASAWDVKFSDDARQIVLTPRAGGNALPGVRDMQRTDRAWFDLTLAIGGRFVVQVDGSHFQAEYTVYGSGMPIISSTRGALTAP